MFAKNLLLIATLVTASANATTYAYWSFGTAGTKDDIPTSSNTTVTSSTFTGTPTFTSTGTQLDDGTGYSYTNPENNVTYIGGKDIKWGKDPAAPGNTFTINFNMTNLSDLKMRIDLRDAKASAGTRAGNFSSVQYSINGTDFTTVATPAFGNVDNNYAPYSIDFSAITAINNQASVTFLFTIPGRDNPRISNLRIDNLLITAVPEQTPAAPFVAIDPLYESSTGEAITVDATPTFGFPAEFTYQWCFNRFKIPANLGGTASSINIDNLQANEGTWSVTVTNETGSVEQSFEYRVYVDSDSDGLSDGYEEVISETNINNPDTDNDGLVDGDEVNTYNTNPNSPDSDSDGFTDLYELETAYDPNSAESTPDAQVNIMTAIEVDFNAALGATYEIQFSTDTIEWTVIEAGIV
ncbi:thrombospondin type 3 repeat-containing protein, partial [Akkermansiaceae bacterium]|nr:thrombospondin type 3 repeat-containing protein [Akkermansiaceae bacterium]